jgi:ferredoxin
MADEALSLKENTPGKFFVDSTCIGCDVCLIEGPKYFTRLSSRPLSVRATDDPRIFEANAEDLKKSLGKVFVSCQPQTPQEEEEMRGVMEICPTASIGEKP